MFRQKFHILKFLKLSTIWKNNDTKIITKIYHYHYKHIKIRFDECTIDFIFIFHFCHTATPQYTFPVSFLSTFAIYVYSIQIKYNSAENEWIRSVYGKHRTLEAKFSIIFWHLSVYVINTDITQQKLKYWYCNRYSIAFCIIKLKKKIQI